MLRGVAEREKLPVIDREKPNGGNCYAIRQHHQERAFHSARYSLRSELRVDEPRLEVQGVGRSLKAELPPVGYAFTIAERSNFSATAPVVLDPPHGARTMSPSSASSLMKNGFVARTALLSLTPGPLSLGITMPAERRVADGV